MTTQEAVAHLTQELKKDPSYRIGWQSNIAMAFYDSASQYKKKHGKKYLSMVDIHIIANDAANNFLNLLCSDKKEG
jgi:Tfp pilus assembly protein PilF